MEIVVVIRADAGHRVPVALQLLEASLDVAVFLRAGSVSAVEKDGQRVLAFDAAVALVVRLLELRGAVGVVELLHAGVVAALGHGAGLVQLAAQQVVHFLDAVVLAVVFHAVELHEEGGAARVEVGIFADAAGHAALVRLLAGFVVAEQVPRRHTLGVRVAVVHLSPEEVAFDRADRLFVVVFEGEVVQALVQSAVFLVAVLGVQPGSYASVVVVDGVDFEAGVEGHGRVVAVRFAKGGFLPDLEHGVADVELLVLALLLAALVGRAQLAVAGEGLVRLGFTERVAEGFGRLVHVEVFIALRVVVAEELVVAVFLAALLALFAVAVLADLRVDDVAFDFVVTEIELRFVPDAVVSTDILTGVRTEEVVDAVVGLTVVLTAVHALSFFVFAVNHLFSVTDHFAEVLLEAHQLESGHDAGGGEGLLHADVFEAFLLRAEQVAVAVLILDLFFAGRFAVLLDIVEELARFDAPRLEGVVLLVNAVLNAALLLVFAVLRFAEQEVCGAGGVHFGVAVLDLREEELVVVSADLLVVVLDVFQLSDAVEREAELLRALALVVHAVVDFEVFLVIVLTLLLAVVLVVVEHAEVKGTGGLEGLVETVPHAALDLAFGEDFHFLLGAELVAEVFPVQKFVIARAGFEADWVLLEAEVKTALLVREHVGGRQEKEGRWRRGVHLHEVQAEVVMRVIEFKPGAQLLGLLLQFVQAVEEQAVFFLAIAAETRMNVHLVILAAILARLGRLVEFEGVQTADDLLGVLFAVAETTLVFVAVGGVQVAEVRVHRVIGVGSAVGFG